MTPMATTPTGSGLFSKVAKFVRNPNVHWGDLDKIGREPGAVSEPMLAHSRQTLKDMIERKRHEDAVRKQEFDKLRQLRRATPLLKPEVADESSLTADTRPGGDRDDRALTIHKIDEIETMLSRQWWKANTPQSADAYSPPQRPDPVAVPDASGERFFAPTLPKSELIDFDDMPTLIGMPSAHTESGVPSGAPASEGDWQRQLTSGSGFDSSRLFAAEMADNLSDPDLEEAAVRFANGDDAGAESVLLAALRAQLVLSDVAQAQAEALFDLYRSLGQRTNFEREALNYAKQFWCPAPTWAPAASRQAGSALAPVWHCPAQLEPQALADLPSHLPAGRGLWVDWSGLQQISAPAARSLATLLSSWSEQRGPLYFEGAQVLEHVLRAATPRGVRQTSAFWWTLRMDLLRILKRPDDFAMAAFEYCLTYEVAPTPWQAASCELLESPPVVKPPTPAKEMANALPASVVELELTGELVGDAAPGLTLLNNVGQQVRVLTISCTQMVRVDFSAAGAILNWAARQQASGCQVEFRDVPPLVASFFNLIGINQHAQVDTRTY
jgi:ABC-type transporter Mla MlaB component